MPRQKREKSGTREGGTVLCSFGKPEKTFLSCYLFLYLKYHFFIMYEDRVARWNVEKLPYLLEG